MPKDELAGKNLDHANLSGSNLSEADLSNASLRRARLKGAKLTQARLTGSDLHGAHLEHADLSGADLRDADLTEADLRGVDLERAAALDGVRLAGAKGVNGAFAEMAAQPPEPDRLTRMLGAVDEHNRSIAASVTPLVEPGQDAGQADGAPGDDARREIISRILEIRRQRDTVEDAIIEEIEARMSLHPGSTIDDC
jgi:uncharacterized protein YjbI with pentapeptide repeats